MLRARANGKRFPAFPPKKRRVFPISARGESSALPDYLERLEFKVVISASSLRPVTGK
jgi:hypothetical protein